MNDDPFGIHKKSRDEAKGSAMIGAGATTAAVGGLAGGIPGKKSDFTRAANLKRLPPEVKGVERVKQNVKQFSGAVKEGAPGGILGFRQSAHKGGYYGYDAKELSGQISGPPKNNAEAFDRGRNSGKIKPEKEIIRQLGRARVPAGAALIGGTGLAVAGGVKRAKSDKPDKFKKRDNADKYHGTLAGVGGAGLAISSAGTGVLNQQKRSWSKKASKNVDEAGKLVPAIAGRQGKRLTLSQMGQHDAKGKPYPKTMYPTVSDGDVKRDPKLLDGANKETAGRVGRLRGAATQQRHFAEVYGNTAKVTGAFRTPSAIVGAAGLGGLAATRNKKEKKKDPFAKKSALMSDAELRRRKKFQGHLTQTTSTMGLTALAGLGASAAMRRGKLGTVPQINKVPGLKKVTTQKEGADKLKETSQNLSVATGGLAGVGGYNFAAYTGAESRKRAVKPKAKDPFKKSLPKKKLTGKNVAMLTATGAGGTAYGVIAHENRQKKIQRRAAAVAELENMVLKKNHKPETDMDPVYGDEGIAKNWSPSSSKYDPEQQRHKRNKQAAAATTAATGVAGAASYNEQKQAGKLVRMADDRNKQAGLVQEQAFRAKKAKKAYAAGQTHARNLHGQSKMLQSAGKTRNVRSGRLAVVTAGLGGTSIGLEAKRRSDGWKSYR